MANRQSFRASIYPTLSWAQESLRGAREKNFSLADRMRDQFSEIAFFIRCTFLMHLYERFTWKYFWFQQVDYLGAFRLKEKYAVFFEAVNAIASYPKLQKLRRVFRLYMCPCEGSSEGRVHGNQKNKLFVCIPVAHAIDVTTPLHIMPLDQPRKRDNSAVLMYSYYVWAWQSTQ